MVNGGTYSGGFGVDKLSKLTPAKLLNMGKVAIYFRTIHFLKLTLVISYFDQNFKEFNQVLVDLSMYGRILDCINVS